MYLQTNEVTEILSDAQIQTLDEDDEGEFGCLVFRSTFDNEEPPKFVVTNWGAKRGAFGLEGVQSWKSDANGGSR